MVTITSINVRALDSDCIYTTRDKAVRVELITHAHISEDDSGLISSSSAFLTRAEAVELVEKLTSAIVEAEKIAVQASLAQL